MEGLKEYILRHGRHITDELADYICLKWDTHEIEKSLRNRVYYNVTSSTLGDMTYLSNTYGKHYLGISRAVCLRIALKDVGSVWMKEFAFDLFLQEYRDFDFHPFI